MTPQWLVQVVECLPARGVRRLVDSEWFTSHAEAEAFVTRYNSGGRTGDWYVYAYGPFFAVQP